jgi:hypothetical protein
MKRRLVLLAGALLLGGGLAVGQEPAHVEDLRFVQELRKQGRSDLALEYLQVLARKNDPILARELPLEAAKTRLEAAGEEPDSAKRLVLYTEARAEFDKFLKANPNHPRAAEARLDIARVILRQGKTLLSRARMQETEAGQTAEADKARATFVEAEKQLRAVSDELKKMVANFPPPKTPAEQAALKKLENDSREAELEVALTVFDQAMTYLNEGNTEVAQKRGAKVGEARKALEKIAGGDESSPVTWEARAWVGRCQDELGTPKDARVTYDSILRANTRAAVRGMRLARYFQILALKETIDPAEKKTLPATIIDKATRWLTDYPGYVNTPEGQGIRYELAQVYLEQAEQMKIPRERDRLLDLARRQLRAIEQTENDFTDRARRLKLNALARQKVFVRPVAELKSFEECYYRVQWEAMQMGEDAKKIKDDKELEQARKARRKTIMAALERGLAQPDAKGSSLELNSARATMAYYYLQDGKYREAIKWGEGFARGDPRSSQAATAAVYALQAYSQLIASREKDFATAEELKEDRDKMQSLAHYMEERWPRELAGDMARHEIAARLLREKNAPEAIKTLSAVTPSYPSYIYILYQLAETAFKANEEKEAPIPGDPPDGYRRRAMEALEKMPAPAADADPLNQLTYALGKKRLASELFKARKYKEMETVAKALQAKLPTLKLNAKPEVDENTHKQIAFELGYLMYYVAYGEADAAFKAGKHDQVMALLDPVVNDLNANKAPALQKNLQLGMAILGMALRSSVQLGKLDRTEEVLKALQTLQAEEGGARGADAVLGQLIVLIRQQVEELRKKGNQADLKSATENFSRLLDGLVKRQKSPSPRFIMLLAECYSSMDQHKKAADQLEAIPEPKADAPMDERQMYNGSRLLLVRQLRQAGGAANLEKAQKLLDEALGTKEKPGWGRRSIDVLKERVFLLEASGDYVNAASQANQLIRMLLPKIASDNTMKEHYLELYFHQIYCIYKNGQGLTNQDQKDKAVHDAVRLIVDLEKKQDNFGSEASRKRFEDLLHQEPTLKEQYDKVKGAH